MKTMRWTQIPANCVNMVCKTAILYLCRKLKLHIRVYTWWEWTMHSWL